MNSLHLTKKCLVVVALALVTFAFAPKANAQATDTFTEGAITGATDVDNLGTAVLAYDVEDTLPPPPSNPYPNPTVNGVDFSGNTTQNGVTLTVNVPTTITYGGYADTSTPYRSILTGGIYDDGSNGTIELTGLTSGDTYQVQIFIFDDRGVGDRSATFTGSTDAAGDYATLSYGGTPSGSYAIATFEASGSTQTFDLDSTNFEINAVDVRDLTGATVPEPSTYLMIGLGLVGLVVLRRARGLNVA